MKVLSVFCICLMGSSFGFSLQSGSVNHASHADMALRAVARHPSRRDLLVFAGIAFSSGIISPSVAQSVDLDDLPPDAKKSYTQYRIPLQISADYYLFELQDKILNTEEWGEVGQLFSTGSARGGQGQPNRMERDYLNPMRILALSMPPEAADALRDSQFKFERAMANINKATAGIRRDLPIEIDKSAVPMAKAGWEDGRVALNEFFQGLNGATGLNEMRAIPPAGPNQIKEYGRSQRRYFDLMKKTKLCQNRGGPTLSQAWGQLMVSGYLQDSCGIPDLDDYFHQ